MAAVTQSGQVTQQAGPGVRIDVRRVSQAVHDKYAEMVAQMVQTNAEVTVAWQTAMERIAELEAQVAALKGARGAATVKPEEPSTAAV